MVEKIFNQLGLSGFEISVVFCDNEWIAPLNEQYKGRPGPTNVLSFPMDEKTTDKNGINIGMLGDVVINVQRADEDAKDAGLEPLSEVAFLIIHGICHLAGYDHEGSLAHRAKEMEEVEKDLFSRFGQMLIED